MNCRRAIVRLVLSLAVILAGCGNGSTPEPFRFPDSITAEPSESPDTVVTDFIFADESSILLNTEGGSVLASQDSGDTWSLVGEERFVRLAIGANGSIWGTYHPRPDGKAPLPYNSYFPTAVGVSTDGRRTFERIDLGDSPVYLDDLIETDGGDPLVRGRNELYQLIQPDGAEAALEPYGIPVPSEFTAEWLDDAIVCGGELHAATIARDNDTDDCHLRIWRLNSQRTDWQQVMEFVTLDWIGSVSLACGVGGDMWATSNRLVFRNDPTVGWAHVVTLDDAIGFTGWALASALHDGTFLPTSARSSGSRNGVMPNKSQSATCGPSRLTPRETSGAPTGRASSAGTTRPRTGCKSGPRRNGRGERQ